MNEILSKVLNPPRNVRIAICIGLIGGGIGVAYLRYRKIKQEMNAPYDSDEMERKIRAFEDKAGIKRNETIAPLPQPVVIPDDHPILASKHDESLTKIVEEAEKVVDIANQEPESTVSIGGRVAPPPTRDIWNYEEEVKSRSPKAPYIIHKDEFYGDEMDYSQHTLTFYAGDEIMADEDDSPVYNFETVTGPLKFGHGSGDANVFYVRNDKLHTEYEIVYDPGLFSVEVLGLEIENNARARDIKHSTDRKFKPE